MGNNIQTSIISILKLISLVSRNYKIKSNTFQNQKYGFRFNLLNNIVIIYSLYINNIT